MKVQAVLSVVCSLAISVAGLQAQDAKKKAPPKNSPYAKVQDDPALPRVLLIGDSISIGYTAPTRKLLAGKVNLHRIPTNGGPTTKGLEQIDAWLGDSKWGVIHFNWGLHDLKHIKGKHQVGIEDYEKNLRKLVGRLEATGAKLIWTATTPVEGKVSPFRDDADVVAYNRVAKKIMDERKIAIDDLYAFAKPRLSDIQRPNNVHFTPKGSAALAEQVAKSILAALK